MKKQRFYALKLRHLKKNAKNKCYNTLLDISCQEHLSPLLMARPLLCEKGRSRPSPTVRLLHGSWALRKRVEESSPWGLVLHKSERSRPPPTRKATISLEYRGLLHPILFAIRPTDDEPVVPAFPPDPKIRSKKKISRLNIEIITHSS